MLYTPAAQASDIEILWMFLDGKGLELITYVVIIILYIKIKLYLRKNVSWRYWRFFKVTFLY